MIDDCQLLLDNGALQIKLKDLVERVSHHPPLTATTFLIRKIIASPDKVQKRFSLQPQVHFGLIHVKSLPVLAWTHVPRLAWSLA